MPIQRKHWDLVLTCYEPLIAVTGGIGTYTRLLLQELSATDLSVLVLTARHPFEQKEALRLGNNILMRELSISPVCEGAILENIGYPQVQFSYAVMEELINLEAAGCSFGTIEFPDYGAEGYFSMKAKKFGILHFESAAIRLHSPHSMLLEDNDKPLSFSNFYLNDLIYEEMYCYKNSQVILYGVDAMKERIASITHKFGINILEKTFKIPHPWPLISNIPGRLVSNITRIGYLGRLEERKGVKVLVENGVRFLRENESLKEKLQFHFFGKDDLDSFGYSMKEQLLQRIPGDLRSHFIFHGYKQQIELKEVISQEVDAFIFPSRFENYPNVLLETLPLGRPILVSDHGGMPELAEDFSFVSTFDPLDEVCGYTRFKLWVEMILEDRNKNILNPYKEKSKDSNAILRQQYKNIVTQKQEKQLHTKTEHPVSIIIPHFNHGEFLEESLRSARAALREGDEIIVIDDCSTAISFAELEKICAKYQATLYKTPMNKGPSVARNLGVKKSKNPLIFFLDADNILRLDGFQKLRTALASHSDIDFVYGMMKMFGDKDHGWMPKDATFPQAIFRNYADSGILIKKDIVERVGGYAEEMGTHIEDWEFHIRLALRGFKGEVVPVVAYDYRYRSGLSRNTSNMEMWQRSYHTLLNSIFRREKEALLNHPQLLFFIRGLVWDFRQNEHWREGTTAKTIIAVQKMTSSVRVIDRFLKYVFRKMRYNK